MRIWEPFRAPRRGEVVRAGTLVVSAGPPQAGPGAEQARRHRAGRWIGADPLARDQLVRRLELPPLGAHADHGSDDQEPYERTGHAELAEEALGELGVGLGLGQLPAEPANLCAEARRDAG
jgi:hypothetical protein